MVSAFLAFFLVLEFCLLLNSFIGDICGHLLSSYKLNKWIIIFHTPIINTILPVEGLKLMFWSHFSRIAIIAYQNLHFFCLPYNLIRGYIVIIIKMLLCVLLLESFSCTLHFGMWIIIGFVVVAIMFAVCKWVVPIRFLIERMWVWSGERTKRAVKS